MTLGEFRKLTSELPDDAIIFIKGQDEYVPASDYGFGVETAMVSPDGTEADRYTTAADVEADEELAEVKKGWVETQVIFLDASD